MTDRIIVIVVALIWNITTYKKYVGACTLVFTMSKMFYSTVVLRYLSQVQSTW